MSKIIGRLNPNSQQRLVVYDIRANAPTLQAAMGEGGGQIPLVIRRQDANICSSNLFSGYKSCSGDTFI